MANKAAQHIPLKILPLKGLKACATWGVFACVFYASAIPAQVNNNSVLPDKNQETLELPFGQNANANQNKPQLPTPTALPVAVAITPTVAPVIKATTLPAAPAALPVTPSAPSISAVTNMVPTPTPTVVIPTPALPIAAPRPSLAPVPIITPVVQSPKSDKHNPDSEIPVASVPVIPSISGIPQPVKPIAPGTSIIAAPVVIAPIITTAPTPAAPPAPPAPLAVPPVVQAPQAAPLLPAPPAPPSNLVDTSVPIIPSDETYTTVMFNPLEMRRAQEALKLYDNYSSTQIPEADKSPDSSSTAAPEDIFGDNPVKPPNLYLGSIVYYSPSNWSIRINGRRVNAADNLPTNRYFVSQISRRQVELVWRPKSMSDLVDSWAQITQNGQNPIPGVTMETSKGVIRLVMEPNETFVVNSFHVKQGLIK